MLAATFVTFANSLDPDQDQQNVGPDLDPNRLGTQNVSLKEFFEKVDFEKTTKTWKITQHAKSYTSSFVSFD